MLLEIMSLAIRSRLVILPIFTLKQFDYGASNVNYAV